MFISKPARWLFAAFLATAPLVVQSSVPQLVNYQGTLTDVSGAVIATGDYDISVSMFTAATGGTAAWGPQTFPGVPVVKGYFNIILGPKDGAGKDIAQAFTGPNAFLEVTVKGRTIAPRQQVLSTPYSIKSLNEVPVGTILPFAGLVSKVPLGFLVCDGIPISSKAYPDLFGVIGAAWGDGSQDALIETDFNVPNLVGRFLFGGTTPSELGGSDVHKHQVRGLTGYDVNPILRNGTGTIWDQWRSDPRVGASQHLVDLPTSTEFNLPPFAKVIYIIKY